MRAFLKAIGARLRGSAWMPLAGKAALGALGFLALAFVGSGAAAALMPRRVGAYLGPPATSASAAAPRPAAEADAGAEAGANAEADAGAAAAADAGAGAAAVTADGRVILNLAAEEDLRKLPGIGATKAKAILALRAKLGRFKRPEDLLRVKGIGRKSLARLRPKLLVDPP
ncbi:helix-hairpin-helix domain-containing protein [Polyangium sp. 6x1]|nr:helix-hairpin-helix domain-containing protein [Polyangium sp. 6x1]